MTIEKDLAELKRITKRIEALLEKATTSLEALPKPLGPPVLTGLDPLTALLNHLRQIPPADGSGDKSKD